MTHNHENANFTIDPEEHGIVGHDHYFTQDGFTYHISIIVEVEQLNLTIITNGHKEPSTEWSFDLKQVRVEKTQDDEVVQLSAGEYLSWYKNIETTYQDIVDGRTDRGRWG